MQMVKKRPRDMTWEDYGLSRNRRKELKAFCLQYDEKKSRIRHAAALAQKDGVSSEIEMYSRDCRMIEEAAVRTDSGIWIYLLRSVTLGLPYERIEYDSELGRIHVCRCDFYGKRRLFFSILNKMKMEHKWTDLP